MKFNHLLIILLFLVPGLGWSQGPDSRVIVKFKPAVDSRQAMAALRSDLHRVSGASALSVSPLRFTADGAAVVDLGTAVSDAELQAVLETVNRDPAVEYAEPDLIMQPMMIPNDTRYSEQWDLFESAGGIGMEAAWETANGQGVVVAVIDTGYRPHEDLAANILPGFDFISDADMANDGDGRDNDPRDPGDALVRGECGNNTPPEDTRSSWHGTHVAGTIAAVTNNGQGIAGIAHGAKVIPLRVLGKCGGYTTDITDAIYWAAGLPVDGVPDNPNPAKVINLSLGSTTKAACLNTYRNAIDAARAAGAVVVIAAGNSAKNADDYPPANCDGALTIAATNRDGGRSFYSNYGSVVDVAAPGGAQSFANDPNGILSTINLGDTAPEADGYGFYQGTSMAAPHVAGLAALVFSQGGLSGSDVETIVVNTSRAFPAGCEGCGAGIIDAAVAVQARGKANLAVEILADDATVSDGTVRYSLQVINNGFVSAANVQLTLQLPAGAELRSAVASQGNCNLTQLTCDLGSIAKGQTVEVSVQSTISGKDQLFAADVATASAEFNLQDNRSEARFGGAALLIVLAGLVLVWRRSVTR